MGGSVAIYKSSQEKEPASFSSKLPQEFLNESSEPSAPPAERQPEPEFAELTAVSTTPDVAQAPDALTALTPKRASATASLAVVNRDLVGKGSSLAGINPGVAGSQNARLKKLVGRAGKGLGQQSIVRFLDVEHSASNLMFVVDISGSMANNLQDRERCLEVFGEVARVISGLEAETRFNIIVFGGQTEEFRNHAVLANEFNKDRAYQFLSQYNPANQWADGKRPSWSGLHRGTKVFEAMEEAFKSRPEAIFLVGDGAPSGSRYNASETLQKIGEIVAGPSQGVVIHAFAIAGNKQGETFMEEIAEIGGGQFKLVK